jgi:O-antigen/teichoic acid export membrane protein
MRLLRRFALDILIIALLFLLPLGFFFQQTLGGKTLIPSENLFQYEPYASYREVVSAPDIAHNHLVSDLILENYQWKSFIRSQFEQGEVPLWNPHQFAGIPFLAAGQHSALYPLSLIYYLLPLSIAYGWFTVINLWLTGVFMYLFARGLGIARAGSMLAGVIYQFGGFVIASVVFQMMIGALPWLPLMMLMAEFIIREQNILGRKTAIPWVAIGATALGLNVLAGHVEITLYSLLITGFYAGIRWLIQWFQTREHGATLRKAAWLLTMVILGLGLASLQFIPLYDFVQTNWRAERGDYETVVAYAHPMRDVLQFFIPNFYGNPAHHHYLDVFSGETITAFENGNHQSHTEWGIKNYVESALYLGILPLILALYAFVPLSPPPQSIDAIDLPTNQNNAVGIPDGVFAGLGVYHLIFGSLGVLSLTFMFGLPSYRIIYFLPGFNQLNSPFRWIFALTVCVAILAAFGLDKLQKRVVQADMARHVPTGHFEIRFGLLIMSLATIILLGLGVSYFAFPQLEATIEQTMNNLAKANEAFGSASMFYSYQFVNVAIFAVMLFLSGVLFVRARRSKNNQWVIFAIALVVADLMIASWGFNPASDSQLLNFTPPAIEWLQQQEGDFRYTTLEPPNTRAIFNANSTMQYGLDDIRGYDSIIPRSYVDYMRLLAPQVQLDYNRVAPIFTAKDYNYDGGYAMYLDSPLFHLLNLRYVITYPDVMIPFQDWKAVYGDEAVVIWENPHAVPRAYLVDAENFPESWLASAPDRLARDVIPPYTEAIISQNTGREKWLDVSLERDSWLIVSENYMQGWKAFIRPVGAGETDEQQLELVPVASIFQGVLLPEGDWTVRLVYSPRSVQIGFFGSAISAVVMTLLVGMWLWTIFVGVNTEESTQTAKVARNSVAPIILNLFNRSIDFVFAIVMYRLLVPESVGVYNFAVVIFVWFDIFTNFGLDLFLIREVSREKTRSGFYLFNTSFLRFVLSVLGFGLLIIFLLIWQNTVEPLPNEGLIALVLLYVGLFPASLSKGMTSLYYAHEQAEKPAAIATITTINKAIFGVIILLLGWGIVGLASISIFNNFVTLAVLFWAGRNLIGELPRKADKKLLREMVSESYPLLLNHFLATIFFQIDIVILQAIKGALTVAQYSTSYKWLMAINIVPSFFTQALFPMMSRQATENKETLKRSYSFGLKLLLALALPLAVGFTVLADVLTLILAGPTYLPNGAIALTIMIWSIPLGWMNSLTQYALIALNLQRYITRAFFVAVLFNIITNIIFIPIYGFRAAAVTTILSELILLIPFAILMQHGLEQRVNWLNLVWRPVVATIAMMTTVFFLLPINMILALMLASAVYLIVLFALKPLDGHEIAILRPMLPERIRGFLRI